MSISAGLSVVDFPVAEEDAGHQARVDAMVAAPGLRVVVEDRPRHDAGGAAPRHAIARVVAHEQLRRVLDVGPRVELRRVERLADRDLTAIAKTAQLSPNLRFQRGGLRAWLDDALRFPPLQVEEDAREPDGVGPRRGPVDVCQPVATPVGARLEREVALLSQPRVEVHAAAKRVEAVVRHHHQHVVFAELLHDAADHRVVVPVEIEDGVLIAVGGLLACRVLRVEIPPEHVLNAIGGVEHADQRALAQPAQAREEHVLPFAIDVVGLLQEHALVGDALVERPRVLGEAQGGIRADPLRQVHRVVERVRHRHRRLGGIEVDGRHVHREVVVHLDDQQPRDARDGDARRRLEPESHPVAQLSSRQRDLSCHPHRHSPVLPNGSG